MGCYGSAVSFSDTSPFTFTPDGQLVNLVLFQSAYMRCCVCTCVRVWCVCASMRACVRMCTLFTFFFSQATDHCHFSVCLITTSRTDSHLKTRQMNMYFGQFCLLYNAHHQSANYTVLIPPPLTFPHPSPHLTPPHPDTQLEDSLVGQVHDALDCKVCPSGVVVHVL